MAENDVNMQQQLVRIFLFSFSFCIVVELVFFFGLIFFKILFYLIFLKLGFWDLVLIEFLEIGFLKDKEEEERRLKYLQFVQVAAVHAVLTFTNLYIYAKDKAGPLKPGVETVEGTVKSVVGPVYDKFREVPIEVLKFVDRKVSLWVSLWCTDDRDCTFARWCMWAIVFLIWDIICFLMHVWWRSHNCRVMYVALCSFFYTGCFCSYNFLFLCWLLMI